MPASSIEAAVAAAEQDGLTPLNDPVNQLVYTSCIATPNLTSRLRSKTPQFILNIST